MQLQNLPLDIKVKKTEIRIKEWVDYFGIDGVYISFSGGKDSTVLMDIARKLYPSVTAVFFDTGLEFPEIRDFVKGYENVTWIKPEKTFKQVINEYGYPFISKQIAAVAQTARHKPDGKTAACFEPDNERDKRYGGRFSKVRHRYLLDAPFEVTRKCCNVMKKDPAKRYEKLTGAHPITAMMAYEGFLRTNSWMQHGCNAFSTKHPMSSPMSFWTENDVLQYIIENDLKICSVYGDIKKDGDKYKIDLKTGRDRTGCMFCGFGCHLEKPGEGRFLKMKETHPKQYEYIMKPVAEGGLGYKDVIDWLNEHGGWHIEY